MKKILFTIVFIFLIIYSLLFPQIALEASKNGILTWFNQILPALLPFTILSATLMKSHFMETIQAGNSNLLSVTITLVCGFIFGFPIGAKLASDFYANHLLSKRQATLLCIMANNFSTMYVCGYVLPTLFTKNNYQTITYALLYLLPLAVSVLFLLWMKPATQEENRKKTASRFQLDMQIIDAGIISGFESLIKICGYIVLFSLVSQTASSLWRTLSPLGVTLLGNLEITNGIQLLFNSSMSTQYKYIIAIQLLSFGGLSGLAQTASIIKPAGLSIKNYVKGKILLSLILTFCAAAYIF